jgi:hypothetical protein
MEAAPILKRPLESEALSNEVGRFLARIKAA